jgi:hypothetical protein
MVRTSRNSVFATIQACASVEETCFTKSLTRKLSDTEPPACAVMQPILNTTRNSTYVVSSCSTSLDTPMQLMTSLQAPETRSGLRAVSLLSLDHLKNREKKPVSKTAPRTVASLDGTGWYPVHFSIRSRILKTLDLWVTAANVGPFCRGGW